MKSVKTGAIVLLALATMGGASLAWRQYRELVELRAAAMNTHERGDWEKRVAELEKANRELSDQLAVLRAAQSDTEARTAGDVRDESVDATERGARGGRAGEVGRQQAALRELMAKPEVQAILNQQRKLGVERQYAALFRTLNLTPEQAEKLKTILADRQSTMEDVRNVAREQGLDGRTNPEGFRRLIAAAQADIDAGIKAVIGDAGLAQLRNYEQTQPQRAMVDDLQQRLSFTGAPLSQQQADALVQILASNQPPRPAPVGGGRGDVGGFGGGPGGRGDITVLAGAFVGGPGGVVQVTPNALAQAQSILSPPQLAALQQVQQQQQAQKQLQQAVRSTLQQSAPVNQPATGGASLPGGGGRRGGG